MFFFAKNEKGKLRIEEPQLLKNYLAVNPGRLLISITKYKKPRTLKQNRYYWAALGFIANELGYERYEIEELHHSFRAMFLTKNDGVIPIIPSTTKLTTREMVDYVEAIVRFCTKELNIEVPPPSYYSLSSVID